MNTNASTGFYKDFVRLCNSVGKSPCRVAIEIGLAKPTVTRWKNGSLPTDATAMKVAEYFASQMAFEQKHTNRVPVRRVRILRKGGLHDS